MSVLGAVLAGGASSRFGSDKALAVWRGWTLLDHARGALSGVVDEVVVVGRGEIADLPCAGLGPLGGIAAALDAAARRGFGSVMTIGCDMPGVPPALLVALKQRAPSCCAEAPMLGHWPVTLIGGLIDRLTTYAPSSRPCAGIHRSANADVDVLAARWTPGQARGDDVGVASKRHSREPSLSVRRWATDIGAIAIPSATPIANINTRADLAAL